MRNGRTLKVRRVRVQRLQARWIESMWELYSNHYDNAERAIFERDLSDKQYVFLGFEDGTDEVRAFSTASIRSHAYRNRRIEVYFSGDTMVDPRYWGQRALNRAVVGVFHFASTLLDLIAVAKTVPILAGEFETATGNACAHRVLIV